MESPVSVRMQVAAIMLGAGAVLLATMIRERDVRGLELQPAPVPA